MKRIDVKVEGMTCASCEVILERAMKKVPGVQNAQVNRPKEKAVIHCEESVQLEDLQNTGKCFAVSLELAKRKGLSVEELMERDKNQKI